ncbi:MAG: glycerol-3-phosphate 1-O-acyltransferase PlsY [Pseudomonadota bacterium]
MPDIVSSPLILLLWAAIGYLIGSIPFGLLITKAMGMGDVRDIGSGNIGATNVLRTGNKTAAALTLLLDGGKGILVVMLAQAFAADDAVQLAALCAFVGHCLPVWLGFKGGKGVATHLGLMLALFWPIGVLCCLTWLIVAAISRYSSMAALLGAGFAPGFMILLGQREMIVLGVVLAVLIYWRHGANIGRLRAGTEPKIGKA